MQSFAANNNHLIHYWVDFGTESIDFTLGQAKIYAAFPNARMIVSPSKLKKGNVQAQSIYLKQFIDQFPPNTIHICHLSFHSSQTKRFVITQINDQYLVGPDNGFFHLTIGNELHKSFILPVDKFKNNSLTEVYLPGIQMAIDGNFDLANIFKEKSIMVKSNMMQPTISGNIVRLTVLYNDHNGNAFFNLDKADFEMLRKNRNFILRNHTFKLNRIYEDYDDVPEGEALCLFTYGNVLQVAQNAGNAADLLGLNTDSFAILEFFE